MVGVVVQMCCLLEHCCETKPKNYRIFIKSKLTSTIWFKKITLDLRAILIVFFIFESISITL